MAKKRMRAIPTGTNVTLPENTGGILITALIVAGRRIAIPPISMRADEWARFVFDDGNYVVSGAELAEEQRKAEGRQ